MSKAAKSIFVFGIYLMAGGLMLVAVPDLVARMLLLDPPADQWARFAGLVITFLGFYYLFCARAEATGFFRATIYGRIAVLFSLTALVLLGLLEPNLILVGAGDVAGALWTAWALGQDRKGSPPGRDA